MDQGRNNMLNNMFGRASSPPLNNLTNSTNNGIPNNNIDQRQQQQQQHSVDDLLRTIQQSSPSQQQPQPTIPGSFPASISKTSQPSQPSSFQSPSTQSVQSPSSASTTPVSSEQSDNRQNVLLSLLGSVGSPPSNKAAPPLPPAQIGKPSSPPSNAQPASNPPSTENQGRVLLEQIMSSGTKQPTQNPPQQQQQQQQQQQYGGFSPPQAPIAAAPPTMSQPQPRAPSPNRKSPFDFVSAFDAFQPPFPPTAQNTGGASGATKRKPVPAGQGPTSSGDESSMSNPQQQQSSTLENIRGGGDKRKSVENLMETLTRNVPSSTVEPTGRPQGLSSRTASEARTVNRQPAATQGEIGSFAQMQISGTEQQDSPTPTQTLTQTQTVKSESVVLSDTSNGWRSSDPKPKQQASQNRETARDHHSSQHQSIFFDVSQPLESIQAPPESSLSTPIALVKVEPTFLPGSTVGATSWIAYAMTRGRVRVISRASGDRTLLQLPAAFPPSTSVVDMAVFGNRLAGVTSDGGFVIWELPQVITDDVPGKLLVCVVPPPEPEALRSVRWHPKQPDTVAVASESRIYLLNINEAARRFGADPIAQSDLAQVGPVINLSSPLVAFAFDVPHFAIATISEDSTLELWRISNQLPFWSAHIPGEATPSSIDFLDGGLVVGRKNGTIFQLLSVMSDVVLSTLKFIDTQSKDEGTPNRDSMFGHVAYDSRIQTLWIANSRRESLIAVKISFESAPDVNGGNGVGHFEQIVEFVGPKPSIHFVILTADSDPNGEEAHAACIASTVPPGELAVVAFSVHASGVDQIIIRKEWFDNALQNAGTKYPVGVNPFQTPPPSAHPPARTAPVNFGHSQPPVTHSSNTSGARARSPRLEDGEGDVVGRDEGRSGDKSRTAKIGKGVLVKDKDEPSKESKESKEKDKNIKPPAETPAISEPPNGNVWSKDLRRLEESLHTRLGRTLSKELEKQYSRIEEGRAADQNSDIARQQHIIKLISNELTKNTTRVVESAVRSEVTASVLPSLEAITRNEIKNALNAQITNSVGESMKQTLPNEIERLLLRPDVSNHVARTFSAAVTPIIERHVKEAMTKTLIPAYVSESNAMHQDLAREVRSEMLGVKKEVITWQSEALRSQETTIRDLEQAVRNLQEQVKYLSLNAPSVPTQHNIHQHREHRASPVLATSPHNNMPAHLPRGNIPTSYNQPQAPYGPPSGVNSTTTWYPTSQHAPLLAQTLPQQSQPSSQSNITPASGGGSQQDSQKDDWDENYLAVLGTQDPRQLRELLSRSQPDVVMPINGPSPLSQAVVLTLIHRLSAAVGETSPVEEAFKASLWWLQRAANTLNPNDPLISPYVDRVLPNVQAMLNTTKSRLSLLPGGPPLLEASRIISEVQDVVARKSA